MKEAKPFVEEGVHPQVIIKSFRQASRLVSPPPVPRPPPPACAAAGWYGAPRGHVQPLGVKEPVGGGSTCFLLEGGNRMTLTRGPAQALEKLKEWSIDITGKNDVEKRELLMKCAATSLNSKLIAHRAFPPPPLPPPHLPTVRLPSCCVALSLPSTLRAPSSSLLPLSPMLRRDTSSSPCIRAPPRNPPLLSGVSQAPCVARLTLPLAPLRKGIFCAHHRRRRPLPRRGPLPGHDRRQKGARRHPRRLAAH